MSIQRSTLMIQPILLVLILVFITPCLMAQDDATPTPAPSRHGHHTPTPAASKTSSDSSGESEEGPDFDGVQFIDKKLNGLLKVEKVNSELSPSKLLTIYVDLRNKTRKPLEIQVQTIFSDVAKNALSTDDSWVDLPLKPRESTEYCSEALSETARSYLVKIRLEPTDPNASVGPGNDEGQMVPATPSPSPSPSSGPENTLTITPPPAIDTPTPSPTPVETPTPTPTPKPTKSPTPTPKHHFLDSTTLP